MPAPFQDADHGPSRWTVLASENARFWVSDDSLLLPGCAAIISAISLLLLSLRRAHSVHQQRQRDSNTTAPLKKVEPKIPLLQTLDALRLLCTLSLIGLLVATHVRADVHVVEHRTFFSLLGTYVYSSCLALASILATRPNDKLFRNHLTAVLLVSWAVYGYRDVWPLATYTLNPEDQIEGWLLWVKVSVLSLAGVIAPLVSPRQPDTSSQDDSERIFRPEETASLISVWTYSYLDKLIWKGYKMDSLPVDELPPPGPKHRAKELAETRFPHLDPLLLGRRRHLFFSLVKAFGGEYALASVLLVVRVVTVLGTPFGTYQLLTYMETHGEGAVIRPWVWVVWLFVVPVISTITAQTYVFIITRVLVNAQGLLTQLIFNHALRTRMLAEASSDSANSASGTSGRAPSKNSSLGKLFNLATSDVNNVLEGREFLQLVSVPPQIVLSISFLYYVLGWSAFVGLTTIVVLFPLPGYLASFMHRSQKNKMKKTDARVQEVTETVSVIRMIKLFAWEGQSSSRVEKRRAEELREIRKLNLIKMATSCTNFVVPVVTMAATFFAYTVLMKRELTASVVFSSMGVLEIIRHRMFFIFDAMPDMIRAKVSLDRLTDFLYEAELLDEFSTPVPVPLPQTEGDTVGLRAASFTWSDESSLETQSQNRSFRLRIDDELRFEEGSVNLIVGPTGSGKTALLLALLGELHYIPDGSESYVRLPRSKGVAYVAQESWIESDTIRANILFNGQYDETRYQQVIKQCGLQHDLDLFDHGDMTEVGERGLTLSGGQKARVALARAVYSSAGILLIDDVFAALDVHTSKWIVDECFKGDLMRDRTVLLVTHNIALVQFIASFVVSMGQDGTISHHGKWSRVIVEDLGLAKELGEDQTQMAEAEETPEGVSTSPKAKKAPLAKGTLVAAEEVSRGRVSWKALNLYLSKMGGSHVWAFWTTVLLLRLLSQLTNVGQTYWLGYWTEQYEDRDRQAVSVAFYLGMYIAFMAIDWALRFISYSIFLFGSLRASHYIHSALMDSVLGSTLRWLDRTPSSRIITRCTQDIQTIDGAFADQFNGLINKTVLIITQLGGVVAVAPLFSVVGSGVAIFGGWCGQVYMKTQLPVQREQSNARQPILGHLGATMAGLTTIRAYGAQQQFIEELYRRIDRYSRAALTFWDLNRWVGLRLDALANLFAACLAGYLVYVNNTTPSLTGFALNMAAGFSGQVLWWIRMYNQLEVKANSLERVDQYLEIEHEPRPSPSGVAPAYWPASGNLVVEKLSARYSEDGPAVLQDVSFEIKSGERVGIVGRTGSGKSSLTLSLLRLIPTEGRVYYDGIPTDSINLDALRSKITIIPQMPELLSGTLRQNLDPFSEYDDAALNDALRTAGLFSLQSQTQTGEKRITLDVAISSGGSNLSVGQRQILALARAILRQSKLLILDEATSAIDYKTDAVIQRSLREAVSKDVTVLTIAHRLQTIMDADKILVLDSGRIAEFGAPAELLKNTDSMFNALVNESGDRDALRAMVSDGGFSV